MIKTLTIDKFQSHDKTTLEFTPNLNCIMGVSDSGKSAIIRALRALFKKTPMYLRNGSNVSTVSAVTDLYEISRTRKETRITKCPTCKEDVTGEQICKHCGEVLNGKQSEDKYTIDSSVYEKFGASLPDFILDTTKIRPTMFGDFEYDLNFSNQHDDMFFIGNSFSGGTRNKLIMSLCKDSDIIDILIKDFRSKLLSLKGKSDELIQENQKIDTIDSTVKLDIETLRELYDSTTELEILMQELQENELPALYNIKKCLHYSGAENLLNELSTFSTKLVKISDKFPEIIKFEQGMLEIKSLASSLNKYVIAHNFIPENYTFELSDMVEISDHLNQLSGLHATLDKLKVLSSIKIESFKGIDLTSLIDTNEERNILSSCKATITSSGNSIKQFSKQIVDIDGNISTVKSKIESTCKNGICPLIQDKFCDTCIPKLINK